MALKPKTHFKYLFAVDSETTGVCIGNKDALLRLDDEGNEIERHQALSWGIIITDAETMKPVETVYIEVKWNESSKAQREADPKFGTYAENIHGLTFDYLEENGVDEEEALVLIANLIIKYWGNTRPMNCLGHNVHFDIRFLSDLLDRFGIDTRFSQRHIDSFTIGMSMWDCYDSDELFSLVCGGTERKDHNALEDIQLTLEAVRTTRNLFKAMLDGE